MRSEIKLYNMDCMTALREMEDNQFDLAIVDPPYGIKEDGHRGNNRSKLAESTNFDKALWDQGFDLTGYELDQDYFAGAFQRLEAHKKQGQFEFAG